YFNNYYFDGIVVTKGATVGVGTHDMYYDFDTIRPAGQTQFDDKDFYIEIVGMSDYYFDFSYLDITNEHYPTIR
ncbi:MAG: hypothetical protein CVV63_04845, partial [Tenericutes bacterium HGW-Tenericutes-8]